MKISVRDVDFEAQHQRFQRRLQFLKLSVFLGFRKTSDALSSQQQRYKQMYGETLRVTQAVKELSSGHSKETKSEGKDEAKKLTSKKCDKFLTLLRNLQKLNES